METTIGKFFDWLTRHEGVDPAHVVRLRNEWRCLTFGMAGEVVLSVSAEEWPRLWDDYDERLAIMTEGREPADGEIVEAWRSALKGYKESYDDGCK